MYVQPSSVGRCSFKQFALILTLVSMGPDLTPLLILSSLGASDHQHLCDPACVAGSGSDSVAQV